MASETKMPLSFHEWEQLCFLERSKEPEIVIESVEEAVELPEEEPEQKESGDSDEIEEKNEALEHLRNLCRVCGSHGLISISSQLTPKMFSKKPSGDMRPWQVPIAKIIEDCSGEIIRVDDGLPQFICQHCLGYLQHAYTIRLQIKSNTASLKMMQQIANDESITLDRNIDIKRVTKREVDEVKEEHGEEGHFEEAFRGSNIKIDCSPAPSRTVERAIEQKCDGCFARLMSCKSLNDHMQNCENIALNFFFTELQNLFKQKNAKELTNVEFVLFSFKLIFETTKKLQQIAKAKGINVNAVSSIMPPRSEIIETDARVNPFRRNYQQKSPDGGYASGGSQNYTQRF